MLMQSDFQFLISLLTKMNKSPQLNIKEQNKAIAHVKIESYSPFSFVIIEVQNCQNCTQQDTIRLQCCKKTHRDENKSIKIYSSFVRFLIESKNQCRFIVEIILKQCKISDSSLQYIRDCHFKFIKVADFNDNQITQKGVRMITEQFNWNYLSRFLIFRNQIKNKGFEYIVKAKWNLIHCNIEDNNITESGFKLWQRAKWPEIRLISFYRQTNQHASQLKELIKKCYLPNLIDIYSEHIFNNFSKFQKITERNMRIRFLIRQNDISYPQTVLNQLSNASIRADNCSIY